MQIKYADYWSIPIILSVVIIFTYWMPRSLEYIDDGSGYSSYKNALIYVHGLPRANTICSDGTGSNSDGSGTCSWHGGISSELRDATKILGKNYYLIKFNKMKWHAAIFIAIFIIPLLMFKIFEGFIKKFLGRIKMLRDFIDANPSGIGFVAAISILVIIFNVNEFTLFFIAMINEYESSNYFIKTVDSVGRVDYGKLDVAWKDYLHVLELIKGF